MKYIVMEIQSGDTIETATIVTKYNTRQEAESKFHQILTAAALSSVPSHSAIMMSDEGFPLRNECYKHVAAPAQDEPEE